MAIKALLSALSILLSAGCAAASAPVATPDVTDASTWPCGCGDQRRCTSSCEDQHDARSCAQLGECFLVGTRGIPADPVRAIHYSATACDAGESMACVNLGKMYEAGIGVSQNEREAKTYFARALSAEETACEHGEGNACFVIASMAARGEGTARDPAKARELYWRACEHEHAEACVALGAMFEKGDGVEKDPVMARSVFTRACASLRAKPAPGGDERQASVCAKAEP